MVCTVASLTSIIKAVCLWCCGNGFESGSDSCQATGTDRTVSQRAPFAKRFSTLVSALLRIVVCVVVLIRGTER